METQIKLRRKGEVLTVDFSVYDLPSIFETNEENPLGVDLTAYPVIYVTAGRHGGDTAKTIHDGAPHTIVVYKYEWRNGWGAGVILPENFNPSRVRYFKTESQLKVEAEAAIYQANQTLSDAVLATISGIYTRKRPEYYADHAGVEIFPQQEVYSLDWGVFVKTLQEAQEKVAEMRPYWDEWNECGLQAVLDFGRENPGKGNIGMWPSRPPQSPKEGDEIGICVGWVNRPNTSQRQIYSLLVFKEGLWVKTRLVEAWNMSSSSSFSWYPDYAPSEKLVS